MIELRTKYPPTTNNLFLNVGKRRVPSPSYRAWRAIAGLQVGGQMQGQTPITGPYHMVIELDRPDKRARDVSNYAKAVEDLLVTQGVIRDDSDCQSLFLKWSDRKPGTGAEARIEIEAVNAS